MNKRYALVLAGSLSLFAGCASPHYQVTDPTSNKVYYTTDLKKEGGTTTFKDARTGDTVTLQNVEVRDIPKEEFNAQRYAPAPAAAATAAAK
jgi:hypothetical protein